MTITVEAPREQDGEDVRGKVLFLITSYQDHKRAQAFSLKKLRARPPHEGRRL